MSIVSPKTTRDLRASERRFVNAMQELGYGRFESLRIQRGELVLDPWPTTVRVVKFGTTTPNRPAKLSGEFELKEETSQLFGLIRSVDAGEIWVLEVRGGLPFAMELPEMTAHDTTNRMPADQTNQGQNVCPTVDKSTGKRLS